MSTVETVACQLYLPDGSAAALLQVQKETTIGDLVEQYGDVIVFTGEHGDKHGATPIVDMSRTLVDYNMWFTDDPKYIAVLSLYRREDDHLYDKQLYETYAGMPMSKRQRRRV